ncbi:MAG: N-acetylglucosamine-6-phosphate deacetylase [Alkalinema sp. RU_4_3]|nr:N-acetylglucosamine-6-phosphate deacetylase [Alkalinema sp. RU_4_3]
MYSLQNARLLDRPGLHQLTLEADRLSAIDPMDAVQPSQDALDLAGDWVSLGGLDLQINGALGLAFPDLNPTNVGQLDAIGQFLWQQGVNGYCPTLVTTSIDKIHQAIEAIASFSPTSNPTAEILGIHLEGPCLNRQKRGAHPAEFLQPLTIERLKTILADYSPWVKIITLAPELDPTGEVLPYLRHLGITVSLGHSIATADQAQAAFDQGATMVTHAFNAMPGLHHREPGLLGAAILDDRVRCGFIADGQHLDPRMIQILWRSNPQGLFLVSDALSPLGLADGRYPWDSREIEVINGTARLRDGTLSGTTLSLLTGVQNLVQWGVCSVEAAIALATVAPREAIGLPTAYLRAPISQLLRWHSDHETLTWSRF